MQSAVEDALVFLDFSNIDSEQFEEDEDGTESDLHTDLHDTFGSQGVFGSHGFWQDLVGRMKRSSTKLRTRLLQESVFRVGTVILSFLITNVCRTTC